LVTRVAVVIVNLNGGSLLSRALDALSVQTVAPARVIVVDNASFDGSADRLEERHPGTEVIRLADNLGFAAANNLGLAAADDCEWVALLNPDAFAERDWLATLVAAAEANPEFTFFGSRLLRADMPAELDGAGDVLHVSGMAWRRHHGEPATGTALEREEIFSPCAAAALYHRDAFIGVGGFDESYFCYFEDTDLAYRLRLAGHRCLYVPEAVVHHVGSAIAGVESDFTIYHSFRNLVWTWVKNTPRPLLWLYLPQHLLVNGLLLAAFALRGRPTVILRAQRDALRGLPRVLRERRVVQEMRRVEARELRCVMERGAGGYATTFGRAWQRLFRPPRRRPVPAEVSE
jgi:GT2 family glycosyltransferase